MTNEELQNPPTEIEISRVMLMSDEITANVLRRLAFERDLYLGALNRCAPVVLASSKRQLATLPSQWPHVFDAATQDVVVPLMPGDTLTVSP